MSTQNGECDFNNDHLEHGRIMWHWAPSLNYTQGTGTHPLALHALVHGQLEEVERRLQTRVGGDGKFWLANDSSKSQLQTASHNFCSQLETQLIIIIRPSQHSLRSPLQNTRRHLIINDYRSHRMQPQRCTTRNSIHNKVINYEHKWIKGSLKGDPYEISVPHQEHSLYQILWERSKLAVSTR